MSSAGPNTPAREAEADAQRGGEDLRDQQQEQPVVRHDVPGEHRAHRFPADAEYLGNPDRRHSEGGPGHHGSHVGRDGRRSSETGRELHRAHVGSRDQRARGSDQGKSGELHRPGGTQVLHLEEWGALEARVDDHVADRGGDGDRSEGTQRVVPQDYLVREDDAGERRIEGGGDGGSDPATDADVAHPAPPLVDVRNRRAERRSQVGERPVLPGRCAGAERYDAGRAGEQAGASRDVPFESLHRAHDVGRSVRPLLGNELVEDAHHQAAHGGNEYGNDDQECRTSRLWSTRGRDEELIVEQGHHVDEEHRRERGDRADREPQDRDRDDRAGEAGETAGHGRGGRRCVIFGWRRSMGASVPARRSNGITAASFGPGRVP